MVENFKQLNNEKQETALRWEQQRQQVGQRHYSDSPEVEIAHSGKFTFNMSVMTEALVQESEGEYLQVDEFDELNFLESNSTKSVGPCCPPVTVCRIRLIFWQFNDPGKEGVGWFFFAVTKNLLIDLRYPTLYNIPPLPCHSENALDYYQCNQQLLVPGCKRPMLLRDKSNLD